jgi:hypothetical protein
MQIKGSLIRMTGAVCAAVILFAAAAYAGPPLICHQIEIGNAKSLPWVSHDWNLTGGENYDTKNLATDTLGILDSNAPVLVRMEALRRATLYARKDPQAAKELLAKLTARTNVGPTSALAWFDAGYLVSAYRQWLGRDENNPAAELDGYAWVKKAIALRGDDPEMDFAAALITLSGPADEHRAYVEKAIAGTKSDPLLAQNFARHFIGNSSPTIAELLTRPLTAKN